MWRVRLGILLLLMVSAPAVFAVEVAPRISDREIIESLAELKAGQKGLQQQIDEVKGQIAELRQSTQQQFSDLRQDMNARFEGMNQRFEGMNQRFEGMNQRFEDMNQRFEDMNQRLNDVMTLLQIIIGILAIVLGSMLAWLMAIWRRLIQGEERQKAFELQEEQIRFLREDYGRLDESHRRLEGIVLQFLERAGGSR
jgi:DNA repair exonuclease SbcCD ATPase subunit